MIRIMGIWKGWAVLAVLALLYACGSSSEEPVRIKGVETPPVQGAPPGPSATPPAPLKPGDIVASVDGTNLTKEALDREWSQKMKEIQAKVPKDKINQVSANLRRSLVDDFIVRTLLTNEVNRRRITVTEEEVNAAMERVKEGLPRGMTMEEMMRKAGLTPAKLREEIVLGIKVNKMVAAEGSRKPAPTPKEIAEFYRKNKERFKISETVRVRHILVGVEKGDNAEVKAQKRQKAENIRRQLLEGADFDKLARLYSDCPSKADGGDLGYFSRGQMVKPFEDAAFRQAKREIGPVVETPYGYHIIQVLEKKPPRTHPLDDEAKARITAFLKEQKRYETFEEIMDRLKAKARITVADRLE